MPKKRVYFFSAKKAEGNREMKELLGGKGANLAEMCNIGLPVPPGFTISTEVCRDYVAQDNHYPPGLEKQIESHLKKIETESGKRFGDSNNPLLVSVRSGAAVSMPGMMDTILNLGLNDESVDALAKAADNPRFAWDAYRRLIQMYGNVARKVPMEDFDHEMEEIKRAHAGREGRENARDLKHEELNRVVPDTALDAEELKELAGRFKAVFRSRVNAEFPQNPRVQLQGAIDAVFGSWNNPRAVAYRELHDIKGLLGTAVNVQAMVFGNLGENSGTGVGFTRNPSTGDNDLYGEFLMNAQGEDVVAGVRTPLALEQMKEKYAHHYSELQEIRKKLEQHYRDMQDFEFTIEKGRVYMLQTRTGKRTARAAVKIAVDMAGEKRISRETALRRIEPKQVSQLLHPDFDADAERTAEQFSDAGLPASPGAAVGQAVFDAQTAEQWKKEGKDVILCRLETSPEDIRGMHAANGILTARGGMTSHAAVVARGMGKCCVAGAGDVAMDEEKREMRSHGRTVAEGDWISLNGSKGMVYLDKINTVPPAVTGEFGTLMQWADRKRTLGIRANADTPEDAAKALEWGAEGIGLCRTEHMFFAEDRIAVFREVILAAPEVQILRSALRREQDPEKKKAVQQELEEPLRRFKIALDKLLPMQRDDFIGIFKVLAGKPCVIRLLDPPLHEFLPHTREGQEQTAATAGLSTDRVQEIVQSLQEANPMLGHRGCRLGITYPEITAMQARAIIEAALAVSGEGKKVEAGIMVPLAGHVEEFRLQKQTVLQEIDRILEEKGMKKLPFKLKVGTMIEVPRAALTAGEIAREADFFSFGTNDLTQMGCGFSRDDAGTFLGEYVDLGIYAADPFQTLDEPGIGRMVRLAKEEGKKANAKLETGLCGEHGGDPLSVGFIHHTGLNYTSCSPFRVPVARLVAAQAALAAEPRKKTTRRKPSRRKNKTGKKSTRKH